ncbi:MAG: linear amide C-N hydrolase [Pseudomonadota bacterium]
MRGIGSFQMWASITRLWISVTAVFSFSAALACSTVAFRNTDQPLLAYNFDFEATDAGYLLINPIGTSRRSIMEGDAASWTSRFGSITVNQIGPGMPAAGMNTAGLVISLMWNREAVYSGRGNAPVVSELEFIQRLLDTSGTVEEALAGIDDVSIRGLVPIHYFLFDASGNAAIVTPGEAGLMLHQGNDLPVPALTNTSYPNALDHLKNHAAPIGAPGVVSDVVSGGAGSLKRFRLAAAAAAQMSEGANSTQAFDVLDDLATPSTRWQVVFEPVAKRVTLRIAETGRELSLDLAKTDFDCRDNPLGVNLKGGRTDPSTTGFTPISQEDLSETMSEVLLSMKSTAALGSPEVVKQLSAGLLASSVCRR